MSHAVTAAPSPWPRGRDRVAIDARNGTPAGTRCAPRPRRGRPVPSRTPHHRRACSCPGSASCRPLWVCSSATTSRAVAPSGSVATSASQRTRVLARAAPAAASWSRTTPSRWRVHAVRRREQPGSALRQAGRAHPVPESVERVEQGDEQVDRGRLGTDDHDVAAPGVPSRGDEPGEAPSAPAHAWVDPCRVARQLLDVGVVRGERAQLVDASEPAGPRLVVAGGGGRHRHILTGGG